LSRGINKFDASGLLFVADVQAIYRCWITIYRRFSTDLEQAHGYFPPVEHYKPRKYTGYIAGA
jgi:hypothetical protein